MKNMTFAAVLLCILFMPFFISSCTDEIDKHYDEPEWLKGSAWEVLEDKGNYSLFLKAVELAGFRPIMEGKSILTVMAPNDEVFSAYLKKHNYEKVDDIDAEELKKVIGFHLLYYSYNKNKLVNFRPEGDLITEEEMNKNAGMYYKFRTHSSNAPTKEVDPSTGKQRMVYHLDRFLPIFSYRFWDTKNLDAASNYNYFYPNSTWKGNGGFNVSNASVSEYEILADNGYIYTIDQILEPLETIYTQLESNENYSIFFNLYNENTTYTYDATLSKDFGSSLGADSLFIHTHGTSLPAIAVEWYSTSYADVADNASKAYSVFAPSDEAMNYLFENYWGKGGYESLDDVDDLAMKYMLNQFIYEDGVAFPGEITNGKVKNMYGMLFNFDPSLVTDRAMCVNGAFYGLSTIETPLLFASVVGPAFRDKDFNYYLYMLHGAGLITSYSSQDTKYVMLVPSNAQIESEGIYLKTYVDGSKLQQETEDGLVDVSSSTMTTIVNMHTATGIDGLDTEGTQIVATQTGFNYWYVKNGKITSSADYNRILEPDNNDDPFVKFTEIKNGNESWNNGKTYKYEAATLWKAQEGDGLQHRLCVCNDARYVYYQFAHLLQEAGMALTNYISGLIGASHVIAFIPTNEAVKTAVAAGKIPGMDTTGSVIDRKQLREYLLSYFVCDTDNAIITYPYPGSAMKSATYNTASGTILTYTDSGNALSIKVNNTVANVISDYDFFPFAFDDGCFQLIDKVL